MKGKVIKIDETKNNKMDMKKCYMRSVFNFCFLETNNVGDIYFSTTEQNKWEFKKTDIQGAYTIKHINTNLFLTSNEKGDIFSTIDLNSSFQKWFVFNSSEAETYAYQNVSNGLYFNVSLRDEIYLDQINTNTKRSLINTFQFFPKK